MTMYTANNITVSYPSPWFSINFQERMCDLPSLQSLFKRRTLLMAAVLFFSSQATSNLSSHINPLVVPRAIDDQSQDLALVEIETHFQNKMPKSKISETKDLAQLLLQLSKKYNLSPSLLLSLIDTESSFRVKAVSSAGALGLMQIKPSTAKEVAKRYRIYSYKSKNDLFNPKTNLRIGVAYLSYLRKIFGESSHYLSAYNIGPTAMSRILSSGNYEGVSLHSYADKIQTRTLKMRERTSFLTAAAY